MKRILIGLVLFVCIVTAGPACGGSKGSTVAPTPVAPAPPTLTSITINGPDAILTRTEADYTVTASFSNQTTQTVTATWTGSPSGLGSVSSTGRVSALVHGSFTLTASYQGQSATKMVNMVSNFEGPSVRGRRAAHVPAEWSARPTHHAAAVPGGAQPASPDVADGVTTGSVVHPSHRRRQPREYDTQCERHGLQ